MQCQVWEAGFVDLLQVLRTGFGTWLPQTYVAHRPARHGEREQLALPVVAKADLASSALSTR